MEMQELSAGHGTLTAAQDRRRRATLCVLHSLLADRHAFDPVLPALAARHRVTLFNLPGFHGSQPTLLALMDAYVACHRGRLRRIENRQRCHPHRQRLWRHAWRSPLPSRIRNASPSWCSAMPLRAFRRRDEQAFAAMAEKVAEGGLGAIAEIAAKRVFSPAYLAAHPEAIEERKKVLMGIEPKAFQAACKILQETDLTPELRKMPVPTLVSVRRVRPGDAAGAQQSGGEQDQGARYVELPGCGHCPPLEQPQAFLAAIKEFCRAIVERRSTALAIAAVPSLPPYSIGLMPPA